MADEDDYKIVTATSTDIVVDTSGQLLTSTSVLLNTSYYISDVDLLSKINDLETRLKALEEAYMELILLGKSE